MNERETHMTPPPATSASQGTALPSMMGMTKPLQSSLKAALDLSNGGDSK